jgi:hypothetical protein
MARSNARRISPAPASPNAAADWLTPAAAATLLGYGNSTSVTALIAGGKLRAVNLSSTTIPDYRVDPASVVAFNAAKPEREGEARRAAEQRKNDPDGYARDMDIKYGPRPGNDPIDFVELLRALLRNVADNGPRHSAQIMAEALCRAVGADRMLFARLDEEMQEAMREFKLTAIE